MKYVFLIIFILLSNGNVLNAQPSLSRLKESSIEQDAEYFTVRLNASNANLASIRFTSRSTVFNKDFVHWFSDKIKFRQSIDDLRLSMPTRENKLHWKIDRYDQYYKGLRVEFGTVAVLSYALQPRAMHTEFYTVPDEFDISPVLTAEQVFQSVRQRFHGIKFAWEQPQIESDRFPEPELLILATRFQTKNVSAVLCYRVRVKAYEPEIYRDVYVNAADGTIEYERNLLKAGCGGIHDRSPENIDSVSGEASLSNLTQGQASIPRLERAHATVDAFVATRYSGRIAGVQVSDDGPDPARPYILQVESFEDRHNIFTKNYQGRIISNNNDGNTSGFSDNDNTWLEYSDADLYTFDQTLSGAEAHAHLQLISRYWNNIHGLTSWDRGAAELACFVNVGGSGDASNASWKPTRQKIYCGKGTYDRTKQDGSRPWTSLDVIAHEYGHAITTNLFGPDRFGFDGNGEPGALDEGFSDIWAICAENYFNISNYNGAPSAYTKAKWTFGEEIYVSKSSIRNHANPKSADSNNGPAPDTYKKINWAPTTAGSPDDGGIHTNCSILTKWFYLLAQGGAGVNDNGYFYDIQPVGVFSSPLIPDNRLEMLVYATEQGLSFSADYNALRDYCITVAESMVGNGPDHPLSESDLRNIRNAWAAVGLAERIEVYDMSNTNGVFSTNNFKTITVGKYGYVWAGTERNGLYKFNDAYWLKASQAVSGYNIRHITTGKNGSVWLAQSGSEEDLNAGGGIYCYTDSLFSVFDFYDHNDGLRTRNVQSLYPDSLFNSSAGRIWSAEFSIADGPIMGGVSYGVNGQNRFDGAPNRVFNPQGGAEVIGGNNVEVWAYADKNSFSMTGPSQLIRYSAQTADFLGFYESSNVPVLQSNFYVTAIYFDKTGNKWVGTANNQLVYQAASGDWGVVSSTGTDPILPFGAVVLKNAITGDDQGNVYFGTNKGLVIYNGLGIANRENYSVIDAGDGLPSNVVNGVAYDKFKQGVWMATSKGIAFYKLPDNRSINLTVQQIFCTRPGKLKINVSTSGVFNQFPSPNKFILQLSDGNADFSNAILLGEINQVPSSPASYNMVVNFPDNLPPGRGYHVRLLSTNPKLSVLSDPLTSRVQLMPTSASTLLYADYECPSGEWTNYYADPNNTIADTTDDVLLLSLKKNGNNLGELGVNFSVKVGISNLGGTNNSYELSGALVLVPFWSMNRYWKVDVVTANQPTSPVDIRFYYLDQDFFDVLGSTPVANTVIDHKRLIFYKTDGNPDPALQLAGATRENTRCFINDEPPLITNLTWAYSNMGGGVHRAEFRVSKFSGGSGGFSATGGVFTSLRTYSIANGNWSNPATWSTGVVPDQNTDVEIGHAVQVDIPGAQCRTLTQKPPAIVTVLSGNHLNIRQ